MIYITTDTHFGHKNIINLCHRPENFEDLIIRHWNNTVKEGDTVIHLGDIAFGKEGLEKVKLLKGRKILVKGNHDRNSLEYYMNGYFDFACDELVMKVKGVNILFTHIPKIFHEYDVNIHGHLHNCAKVESVSLLYPIALEENGYTLTSLDSIIKSIRSEVDRGK